MKTGEDLRAALITACQTAASQVGSNISGLSWFYRNTVKNQKELNRAA